VAGSVTGPLSRRFPYRARHSLRLWRAGSLRLTAVPSVLALALALGGCSFSYQLVSLFEKNKDDNSEMTGSLASKSVLKPEPAKFSTDLPDGDLAYARAAVADALTQDSKATSVPWENPQTGARGTVTPIATAYSLDGMVCRDFLASYVHDRKEAWLQGEACRLHQGKWEVRSMKPWRRT
jgi:surface antigen